MRIPKKGATPPASNERKSKAATGPDKAVPPKRQVVGEGGEPLGLSDVMYDQMFRAQNSKRPAPARRTTARVQRAFADAFLEEAAPAAAPPEPPPTNR